MIDAKSGRYIPWIFVAAFGIVVAANTILIVAATRNPVALVVAKPYEKGLAYNRALEQAREEAATGWRIDMHFNNGRISATVLDRVDSPVNGLDVTATFERPLEGAQLHPVPLSNQGDARYTGSIELPAPGQWEVVVVARRPSDNRRISHVQRVMTR